MRLTPLLLLSFLLPACASVESGLKTDRFFVMARQECKKTGLDWDYPRARKAGAAPADIDAFHGAMKDELCEVQTLVDAAHAGTLCHVAMPASDCLKLAVEEHYMGPAALSAMGSALIALGHTYLVSEERTAKSGKDKGFAPYIEARAKILEGFDQERRATLRRRLPSQMVGHATPELDALDREQTIGMCKTLRKAALKLVNYQDQRGRFPASDRLNAIEAGFTALNCEKL